MIFIEYGFDRNTGTLFRWSCDLCDVDDQALEPDEGIDSIVEHLRRFHDREELVRFGTILTKGMASAAKLADPDHDNGDQVDRIADETTGLGKSPA